MALTVARPDEVIGGFNQPNQTNLKQHLLDNPNIRSSQTADNSSNSLAFPLVCPVQSVPKTINTNKDNTKFTAESDSALLQNNDWNYKPPRHILDRTKLRRDISSVYSQYPPNIPRIATIPKPIGRLLSLPSFDLKAFKSPSTSTHNNTRTISPTFPSRPPKDKFIMPDLSKSVHHSRPATQSKEKPFLSSPGIPEVFKVNPVNASDYLLNVTSTGPKSSSSYSPVRPTPTMEGIIHGGSRHQQQSRHRMINPDFPPSPTVTSVVFDRLNDIRSQPFLEPSVDRHPSANLQRSIRSVQKTNYLSKRMHDDERRGSRHGHYYRRGDAYSDEEWSTIASTDGGDTHYADMLRHSGRVGGRNGVRKYVHSAAARRYGSSSPLGRMVPMGGGQLVAYPSDMYEQKGMMIRSPSNGLLLPWTPMSAPPVPAVTDLSLSPVASTSMLTCNTEFRRQFPYVYQGLCKGMIDITRLMAHEIVIPVKEEISIKRSTVRSRKAVTNSVSDRLWRVLQGRFPDPGVAPKLIKRMAEYFYDKIEFGIQDAEDERSFIQWLFRFDVENAIDLRQSISLGAGKNAVLAHIEGSAHINRKKGDLFNLIGPDVIHINLECMIKALFLNGGPLSEINNDALFIDQVRAGDNRFTRSFLI